MISISIIIPVYGVEKYIERCLRSVFSQDYKGHLECILVDDCGPDNSMEIAKELIANYSGPIVFKLLKNEKNSGLSVTRNNGVNAASGDYVFFLDSDDELAPDSISSLAQLAIKYPGVDIVCGDWYVPRKHRTLQTDPTLPEYMDSKKVVASALLHEGMISMTAPNKLLKRAFLDENNLSFRPGLYHEDELYNFYLAEAASTLAVSFKPTYIYFLNPNSITSDSFNERRLSDLLAIVEEILTKGKTFFRCPASFRLLCIIARSLPKDSPLWTKTKKLMKITSDMALSFGFFRIYFFLLRCRCASHKGLRKLLKYRKTGRIQRKTFKSICKHQ